MKKLLSVVLCLSLVFSLSVPAFAAESIPIYAKNDSSVELVNMQPDAQTRSISSGVAVFFLGILVGYVIDGVFFFATGHSVGELTSELIEKIVNYVKKGNYTFVVVDENGNVVGRVGKFSVEGPVANY